MGIGLKSCPHCRRRCRYVSRAIHSSNCLAPARSRTDELGHGASLLELIGGRKATAPAGAMLSSEHGVIAIVRTIIETHNGQIAVDNRNGSKGAACRVKLPMG